MAKEKYLFTILIDKVLSQPKICLLVFENSACLRSLTQRKRKAKGKESIKYGGKSKKLIIEKGRKESKGEERKRRNKCLHCKLLRSRKSGEKREEQGGRENRVIFIFCLPK